MQPNPFGFDPTRGPGDTDMIIAAELFNPHKNKVVKIISGEYEELNGKTIAPGKKLKVSIMVPEGFREYINPTQFKNTPYIYIGLIAKEAAEPMIYKPTL